MSAVGKVLKRTLVRPFYQVNAGFFLVTLGLLFGFFKTPQHIDIATAMAYNPLYYCIPFGLFFLYTLKTLQFCYTAHRLPSNQLLGWLVLLKPAERVPLILWIQTQLLLPVIAYSGLLLYVAAAHQLWLSVAIVISGNALLIFGAGHLLNQKLISSADPKLIKGLRLWTHKLPRKLSTLFIHHLFNRQAVLLLGTKVISIAIVIGAITIYEVDTSDQRIPILGMLLCAGVNSPLSIRYQRFEQYDLDLFQNLPIPISTRFGKYILTYLFLFIPEIAILFFNTVTDLPLSTLVGGMLLPVALLSFYQAVLYRKHIGMDHFIRYPFFTTAILFFTILGYVPAYAIVLLLILISYTIFRICYNSFELIADKD